MLSAMLRSAALLGLLVALAGCGADEGVVKPGEPSDPGLIHVHGLGRNPADGALLIATHTGLFTAAADAAAPKRVAGNYQDTMGFTVLGPDHFLGSGHPGTVDDPPFLGLIESRNAGRDWRPVSLRGTMDFHVLEAQGDMVYGFGSDFETREARFLQSGDRGRSWSRRTPPEALTGLAIDPSDGRRIVALGEQRGYVSDDAGRTWRPIPISGGLVTWTPELGVVAVDHGGVVRRAEDPVAEWREVGEIGGEPAAFDAAGDELLAATHDGRIVASRTAGESWKELIAVQGG
jgi:hypothetical protein